MTNDFPLDAVSPEDSSPGDFARDDFSQDEESAAPVFRWGLRPSIEKQPEPDPVEVVPAAQGSAFKAAPSEGGAPEDGVSEAVASERPTPEVIAPAVITEPALRPYYPPPRVNAEHFADRTLPMEAVAPDDAPDTVSVVPAVLEAPDARAVPEAAQAQAQAEAAAEAQAAAAAAAESPVEPITEIPRLVEPSRFAVNGFPAAEPHPVTASLSLQEVFDSPSPRRAARDAERLAATETDQVRLNAIAAAVATATAAANSAAAAANPATATTTANSATATATATGSSVAVADSGTADTAAAGPARVAGSVAGGAGLAERFAAATPPSADLGPDAERAGTKSSGRLSSAQKTVLWIAASILLAVIVVALLFMGRVIGSASATASRPQTTASATTSALSTEDTSVSPGSASVATPTTAVKPVAPTVGLAAVGEHPWQELRGGECLEQFTDAWAPRMSVVACSAPHTAQLVLRSEFPNAPAAYPGAAALQSQVAGLCSISDSIALGPNESITDAVMQASFAPTAAAWAAGDTGFRCFVNRLSGGELPGSVAVKR